MKHKEFWFCMSVTSILFLCPVVGHSSVISKKSTYRCVDPFIQCSPVAVCCAAFLYYAVAVLRFWCQFSLSLVLADMLFTDCKFSGILKRTSS